MTTTALDAVDAALAAIDEHAARTNAFIHTDPAAARAAARAVDEERRRGVDRGPLHGMPVSLKDLIDVAGLPTTAASRVRAGHVAAADAPIVTRLREAGVVLIGKTNLHEFALGPTNDESAYGPVRNPHDVTRVAGGSSGGSAAAVATGMGAASIGSDTGGSIRIPAAACGVVGLKPSIGEVPTAGVVPLSDTLDHVGPLTTSVIDAANLWAVLAGRPLPQIAIPSPRSIRLGTLGGYFTEYLSSDVRTAFDAAIEQLCRGGVTVEPREIAGTELIVDTYSNISLPEAANWHGANIDTRAADYQSGVLDRLHRGRKIAAVDYLRARETRTTLGFAIEAALDGVDALVLPTLPIVAPRLGETDITFDGGRTLPARAALLRLTQLFNLGGQPAITLPVAAPGMPVGLQFVGSLGETEQLLAVAAAVERLARA